MNRRELELHLQDLFEGRLETDALESLQQELRSNPEAQDTYCDYARLHNALQLRAEGVDLLNVVPMDLVIERRQRRTMRTACLAAAAMLAIGLLLTALVAARKPKPTLTFNTSPGTELSVSHALEGEYAPAGMVLEPGSRLTVINGTVELEFTSGVRGIVRGPADLTLQREDLLELANGTAWFEVPADAVGFKVNTPDLILTDLGTEFGIISEPNFLDEVHVFVGKVEVRNRSGLQHKELLQAGQARYAGPAGRWQETPVRRDHFLDELPTQEIEPAVVASSAQAAIVAQGQLTATSGGTDPTWADEQAVVDGTQMISGEGATGLHKGTLSVTPIYGWYTSEANNWFKVDLGATVAVGKMYVWNGQEEIPDRGVESADIYYSTVVTTDPIPTGGASSGDWILITAGQAFNEIPVGTADFLPSDAFDLDVSARSIGLYLSGAGGISLSELQFEVVP